MPRKQHLPPEYERALQGLITVIKCEKLVSIQSIDEYNCTEGIYTHIIDAFKNQQISPNETWRWNQTKAKRVVKIVNGNISFYKLTPRKRVSTNPGNIPAGKLWKFVISRPQDTVIQILWCEQSPNARNENTNSISNHLKVRNYSFLAPLMDPDIAIDLWPSQDS